MEATVATRLWRGASSLPSYLPCRLYRLLDIFALLFFTLERDELPMLVRFFVGVL